MEKKHLAEVLSVNELLNSENNRICVLAGVGAGENTFITEHLKGYGNIFFVSSRRATIDEMLMANEICEEKVDWHKFSDEILTTTNYGVELLVKNKRFSTTGIKNIIEHFDIIVIDEFHSLQTDATFANSSFHLYSFLDYISAHYRHIKIIVMTGTEEPIKDILERDDYMVIDKRDECINVLPKSVEVITRERAIRIIQALPKNQKTIYYTNSTGRSIYGKKSLFYRLKAYAEGEIAFAVSKSKAKEIEKKAKDGFVNLCEISEGTKKFIIENNRLPEKVRVLITTSTLKEGINILSEDIKVAFCESHLLSDIQQFAGRVRNGLEKLYIINDARQFDMTPKQYRASVLEMYFNFLMLKRINEFFNNEIKNEESMLYMKGFGGYNPDDIELKDFFFSGDWSIYGANEAVKVFIDLVEEKFRYVRFNHLESRFELFVTAHREQIRVHRYFEEGWEKAVSAFCKEKGIEYTNNTDSKGIDVASIVEGLEKFVGKNLILDERDELRLFISNSFGLKGKSPKNKTCNDCLKKYNLPYRIKASNTDGNRYLRVIRVGEDD